MRSLAAVLLSLASLATAQLSGPAVGEPQARVVCDLLDEFPWAEVRNSADGKVNPLARAQAQVMPALGLHPPAQGEAVAAFSAVSVPECSAGQRALLLVHLGLSDGIPWGDPRQPNGVQFTVAVQGQTLLQERLAETGWFSRIVDLTPWAGQRVALELRTNAVDGNAAYDWALFGRPRVVTFRPAPSAEPAERKTAGLALLEFRLDQPAAVTASVGAASTQARLSAGTHRLPVPFAVWAPPELQADPGPAAMVSVRHAPWAYAAQPLALATDSGFATAGRPFAALLTLRNPSEGTLPAGCELRLRISRPDGSPVPGLAPEFSASTPLLSPGEEGAVRWPGLVVAEPSDLRLSVDLGDHCETVAIHVYPPEPQLPAERPPRADVHTAPGSERWALVANPWCRLAVVLDPAGGGYALAEVWNGSGWERTASLYPLLRVVGGSGVTASGEPLRLVLTDFREQRDRLVVSGYALDGRREGAGGEGRGDTAGVPRLRDWTAGSSAGTGARWPVRLSFEPDPEAPRIRVAAEVGGPVNGGQFLAFALPALLAGDRAYGAAKDFALFPGVEYLEGPEASSSTRDLAPPLHDRRTPSPWKIACPVMAVQGRDSLAALAWDPRQEWLPGHRLPAARFLCPAPTAGPEYCQLSLFAPGVGDGTPENGDQATTPVALARDRTARLECWLVLDHVSRYPADSVVRGPRRGGLVTQAVQHWFDLFGLPGSSRPPRSWSAQRRLSREPYLGTLWQDDPPGWSLIVGEAPRANPALAAPLLLDLRAGLAEAVELDVRLRLERIFGRALAEDGMIVPVHGNSPLLQYQVGYVPEALQAYLANARGMLSSRREGLWVWQPQDREHAALGIAGTHTLGQAAYPCLVALRAALYSGDPELARLAVEALRQTEQYEVPRGASMWECPQSQPDILAAALTIKACCEAYRLTGDRAHLAQARYWAWTGLGFIYTWQLDGYPTMLYNTIGVMGSTFFTHSWIGRPVVWMGLDYAYALQDLAEFDRTFDWRRVAAGVTTSALWQQYTEGPSRGCYPDSWELAANRPNPVDINPILIQLNAFRLRGQAIEVHTIRLPGPEGPVSLCAGADIVAVSGSPAEGRLAYRLTGLAGWPVYSSLAQVPRPTVVEGAGEECVDSAALAAQPQGWLYHGPTRSLVLKHSPEAWRRRVTSRW